MLSSVLIPLSLLAAAVAVGCAVVWRGVTVPSSQLIAPSLARVQAANRRIALTFDDGPSVQTPLLLELLARHHVRATFFLCGRNVARLPAVARAIVEAGHEIGNHTDTHRRLCPRLGKTLNLLSPSEVFAELDRAQVVIEQHTGVRPALFRPPYGFRWFGLRQALRHLGLRGVTWSVMPRDWEWSADQIASQLAGHVTPGDIVCLHDGRDIRPEVDLTPLLAALENVLPQWRARGLQAGTVSALLPDANKN